MPGHIHSKKIAADFEEFLEQLRLTLNAYIDSTGGDSDQKAIFKYGTAADTSLRSFAAGTGNKFLTGASGIARRVAILAVMRHVSLMRVELRRLIECVHWYVYFSDHPVEEAQFLLDPGAVCHDARDDPLAAGAHGSPAYYRAYVKSLMRSEKSGIGKAAASDLAKAYAELSKEVHPALGVAHPSGTLALAADRYDNVVSAKMRTEAARILRSAIAIIVASDPRLLTKLDSNSRGWFDWLVTDDWAKLIREPGFGLDRT